MYSVSREKNVWTLKKMWGENNFFSCWVSGQGVTTVRPPSVYSEPKNNCGFGFWACVNELMLVSCLFSVGSNWKRNIRNRRDVL